MKRWVGLIMALGILATVNVYAQQAGPSVDGKWNVSVPLHGGMDVVLEIKQDGKNLTGNFMIPDHGDLEVVGEFADGKIRLNSTENGFMQVSLTGQLNQDGTLSGNLSSTMGDMAWTATRSGRQ